MLEKFKVWYTATGITSSLLLVGAIVGFIYGWSHLATSAITLFLYINWNSIRKIVDKK